MQKRIFSTFLATLMLLAFVFSVPAAAATFNEAQVKASDVNLRSEASTGGALVTKLQKGQKVALMAQEGDWYKVAVADSAQEGYVLGKYLEMTGSTIDIGAPAATNASTAANAATSATPAATPAPTNSVGAMQNVLSSGLSSGATSTASTPTATPAATTPTATTPTATPAATTPTATAAPTTTTTGTTSNGLTLAPGSTLPSGVSFDPNSPQAQAAATTAAGASTVTITAKDVAVRDKASSKGKRLGKLAKDTVLPLLSSELVNKDWYKVTYEGQEAYVSKKYAKASIAQVQEKADITYEWKRPADAPSVSFSAEEQAIVDAIPSKLSQAKSQNSDTVGWIRVPNLAGVDESNAVDYPVLIYKDNDYYLNRDFNKNKKIGGAIYMDYRNASSSMRKHVIVYGHNMQKSKKDFNFLHNFKNSGYYNQAQAKIITMQAYGTSQWEVFSVHEGAADPIFISASFRTNSSWVAYCERLAKASQYSTNIKFSPSDEILTLVTCDNNTKNDKNRLFVHARRIS